MEAAAVGAQRIRIKMAGAVELAAHLSNTQVDAALLLAATAGRFDDGALVSILDHLSAGRPQLELVRADESHSAQPGTGAWEVVS